MQEQSYTKEKVYHESGWAVRRWDWFNDGKIVQPKSFCQFWRTVLLYSTVKWLFTPIRGRSIWRGRSLNWLIIPSNESVSNVTIVSVKVFVIPLVLGSLSLLYFQNAGIWGVVGLWIFFGLCFVLIGFTKIGGWCVLWNILALLWDASVAAKHRICPFVKIIR